MIYDCRFWQIAATRSAITFAQRDGDLWHMMAFGRNQRRPYCQHCFVCTALAPFTRRRSVMEHQMTFVEGNQLIEFQMLPPEADHHREQHARQNPTSCESAGSGTTHNVHSQDVSTSTHADIVMETHIWGTESTSIFTFLETGVSNQDS